MEPGAGASTGAAVVAGTGAAAGGTAGTDTTGGAGAGQEKLKLAGNLASSGRHPGRPNVQ